jgi:hypothetical protein
MKLKAKIDGRWVTVLGVIIDNDELDAPFRNVTIRNVDDLCVDENERSYAEINAQLKTYEDALTFRVDERLADMYGDIPRPSYVNPKLKGL